MCNTLPFDTQPIVEPDDFLRRRTREYHGKDAALSHYLRSLTRQNIIVYHNAMSQEGAVATFVLKTLSKFLGGHVLADNAEKVILVEKQLALECFGYAPGVVGSRRGYMYSYLGVALALGIESEQQLVEYGKSSMLRVKGPTPEMKLLTHKKPEEDL